jgi:hypothetical protein
MFVLLFSDLVTLIDPSPLVMNRCLSGVDDYRLTAPDPIALTNVKLKNLISEKQHYLFSLYNWP